MNSLDGTRLGGTLAFCIDSTPNSILYAIYAKKIAGEFHSMSDAIVTFSTLKQHPESVNGRDYVCTGSFPTEVFCCLPDELKDKFVSGEEDELAFAEYVIDVVNTYKEVKT